MYYDVLRESQKNQKLKFGDDINVVEEILKMNDKQKQIKFITKQIKIDLLDTLVNNLRKDNDDSIEQKYDNSLGLEEDYQYNQSPQKSSQIIMIQGGEKSRGDSVSPERSMLDSKLISLKPSSQNRNAGTGSHERSNSESTKTRSLNYYISKLCLTKKYQKPHSEVTKYIQRARNTNLLPYSEHCKSLYH